MAWRRVRQVRRVISTFLRKRPLPTPLLDTRCQTKAARKFLQVFIKAAPESCGNPEDARVVTPWDVGEQCVLEYYRGHALGVLHSCVGWGCGLSYSWSIGLRAGRTLVIALSTIIGLILDGKELGQ